MGVGAADTDDSGQVNGIYAGAAVPTTSTSASDGLDPPSSASASGMSIGECTLNPDNQAVLQWAFIYNQMITMATQGPASFANAIATQNGTVDVAAQLNNPDPNAQVTGYLRVDIGWVANDAGGTMVRNVPLRITFGNAGLTISDQFGTINASGVDGNGNFFTRDATAPSGSTTGTLAIGVNEFSAPLQAGNTATIQSLNGNPVTCTIVQPFLQPDLGSYSQGGIFQGTFEIHAD